MEEEDDPFGMFGEDDSSSDSDMAENERSRISRSMVETANQKTRNGNGILSTPSKGVVSVADTSSRSISSVCEWSPPWPKPVYLGPMKLVKSLPYGGGRGYIAERDLEPGTLVLLEEPIVAWPTEQLGRKLTLISVLHILRHSNAQALIHQLEHYHPTKRAVDEGNGDSDHVQVANMMAVLRQDNSEKENEILEIIQYASLKGILNRDRSDLSCTDVIRLLLCLRYNGLESGLYLHVAMLNHADQPNCVKFLPTPEKKYSEVRTTRVIRAREPLTISYLPSIVSHASRRFHLWEQHRFDIGANVSPQLYEMELVGFQLPLSSIKELDDDAVTSRIERTVAEMVELYTETSEQIKGNPNNSELWDSCKALEQSSLQLCSEALDQLQNNHHLLLIACLQLHLDSCDLVQRDPCLPSSQRLSLLCRLILTAHPLLAVQERFHGPDHFELASTHLDLAQGLEEVLSLSPKQLLLLQLDGLSSVGAYAALEYKSRKEFERIKSLYPHDAEKIAGHSQNG
jgi:hypothetical protein